MDSDLSAISTFVPNQSFVFFEKYLSNLSVKIDASQVRQPLHWISVDDGSKELGSGGKADIDHRSVRQSQLPP
jgi:hypothetical protein